MRENEREHRGEQPRYWPVEARSVCEASGDGTLQRWCGGRLAERAVRCGHGTGTPQRFWKLVLGQDMSGGGKGVSTAAAITNLHATIFGSCHRLEPLPAEKESRWTACSIWVYDYIVEFFPSNPRGDGDQAEI